jgi:protein involved in temperature-dependent protein secretion
VPTLYPATFLEADGMLHLGRKTCWHDLGSGLAQGVGLQTFLSGEESRTVFELVNARFAIKPTIEPS